MHYGLLFADEAAIARELCQGLCARAEDGAVVYLDVPAVAPAVTLAESISMARTFEMARMYPGPPPAVTLDRTFGVMTFELG